MKLTKQEQEEKEMLDKFSKRMEFRQRNNRMQEIYVDLCDDDGVEPTTDGFINFLLSNE